METEATLADAPQQWTDEKMEDFVEATYSTEVLRSWEDQTIVPQMETLTVPQSALESKVDAEFKDSEDEMKTSPSTEEHGDTQKVVMSVEVEALAQTVQEESTTKLDFGVQAECPACVEEVVTSVSGEGPIRSSEAEEEPEEEPVLSETPVLETAEGFESEKENCDDGSWITHSGVLSDSSEQGEAVISALS